MDENDNKVNINLDKETLAKLCKLANMELPQNLDEADFNELTSKLQSQMSNLQAAAADGGEDSPTPVINDFLQGGEDQKRPRTVLIIDDLGVVVYQLELMFKKLGFEVTTSNRVSDCLTKFKKKDFGYVIMDLFLPTEKEGFLLLDELKKLVLLCKLDTKIIVMTASSKAEYKSNCKNRGADFFIEKTQGWQNELVSYCK